MTAWQPDAEDLAFWRVYGRWDPMRPVEVRHLLRGLKATWWVVGGWAVEAFTGVERAHEDVDVTVFADDFPALRAHLAPTGLHLWSNTGGVFHFIDERRPDPQSPTSQIWVRRDADSPWLLDIPLNPGSQGRWVSKRDPDLALPLAEATWRHSDGVRYLNPELVLHYKSHATQRRTKDEVDLHHAWPLLQPQAKTWLRERLRHDDPEHPWLALLR